MIPWCRCPVSFAGFFRVICSLAKVRPCWSTIENRLDPRTVGMADMVEFVAMGMVVTVTVVLVVSVLTVGKG